MDESDLNPMEELAHLLRLQKYHKRKRRDLQDRVNKLKVSCEIQKRLIRSQPNFQRTLADCIRTGNKTDFRNTFDAFKDVRDLATNLATGRISTAVADDLVRRELSKHADSQSFLDRISRNSRDHVLRFVSDIVSDPDFLINRLMSLNQRQLENIQLGQHLAIPEKSVFGQSTPSSVRRVSSPGPAQAESRASSQVWDLCRHDAFALLLDLIGMYPSANGVSVRRRQELIWASVCARMLSENKPGREKFIIAILDGIANEIEPSGKRALETWIEETLQDGHFLLSQTDKPSFRMRTQGITSEVPADSEDLEAFYTSAIRKLFALLKNNDQTNIIPSRVLNLCRFTVDKLRDSDTRFRTAPFFFLAHWLFSTFMLDNVITPEARGLMLNDSFPETARHRVLRETILRAQKIVFDVSYAWSHTGPVDPSLKADVDAIAAIFRPVADHRPMDNSDSRSSDYFLRSLSPADVYTLVSALYPDKRNTPISGSMFLNATTSTGGTSSASSVSGLSIFRESAFDDLDQDRLPPIPGNDSNLSTESDVSSRPPVSPSEHASGEVENAALRAVTLRSACSEILAVTKSDFVHGVNNPAAESWALLELRDGRVRNIDRIHAFTVEQCEFEIQSDSEQDNGFRNDYDKNNTYLEIRKSLLRLLAEPALGGPQSSNVEIRSSDMMLPFPSPRRQHNPFSPSPDLSERSRTNPFRNRSQSLSEVMHATTISPRPRQGNARNSPSRWPSTLSEAFQEAVRHLEQSEDFTKAFAYSQTLTRIKVLSSSNANTESSMLRYFTRDVEQSVARSRRASAKLEVLASLLEQQNIETDSRVKIIATIASKTRVKMWYCTDVRSAAPYAELEKLATAIRSMDLPRQLNTKRIEPPPLRHKGTLKPKNLSAVKKGESSLVDIMVTDPVYRVLNKLKDEQVSITQQWMDKSGIENICVGEERIHRLLCELSKCLSQLISSDPVASPVLWGSELFQRDRMDGETEALQIEIASNDGRDAFTFISRPSSNGSESIHSDLHSRLRRKSDFNIATASLNSQDFNSDYLDNRSPTLMTRSSTTFWSPSGYRSQSPLSNISPPSRAWSPMHLRQSISRESFQSATKVKGLLNDLRQSVTGLLVSDIMQATFPTGSETDASFFRGVGREFVAELNSRVTSTDSNFGYSRGSDRDVRRDSKTPSQSKRSSTAEAGPSSKKSDSQKKKPQDPEKSLFDLDLAKRRLVRRFDLTNGPYEKLKILHDLETLLLSTSTNSPSRSSSNSRSSTTLLRTRLETSLLTTQSSTQLHSSIAHFSTLFRHPSTRPTHLFRDLQTLASLLPTDILDDTPQGKTFWSATIAALSLKTTLTQSTVEAADKIISHHTTHRTTHPSPIPTPAPALPTTSSTAPSSPETEHPLTHASRLLRLAAAQGHPVAQRELATLYLTHPELVPRVLAPMSRCKEVFRASQAAKWARENSDGRKYDAEIMCVAFHWMERSAEGGDDLAGGFVRGRE
ncbi:Regulatory protein brlA [Elsinoe australis]|uniref:Regulatory protein brlA n=1 Tax=Elsinoe australis TaxID=40998 RepID=A0A2P7YLA6_9PEZI|nr:Regulatory protein brlA [Elsinoe australis]